MMGFNTLTCRQAKKEVEDAGNICVLLVANGCPFCDEALKGMLEGKVKLDVKTIVVSTDECYDLLETWIDYPATPALMQFIGGREVKRAIGLEKIFGFEPATASSEFDGKLEPVSPELEASAIG